MKLQLDHLSFRHGSLDFHYDIEFSQDITGIFGYSGSGKTTLLNLVCGLETPISGRLSYNDRLLFDGCKQHCVPSHQRNFGVVFQSHRLFPHLSVRRNIRYAFPSRDQAKQRLKEGDVVELLDLGNLLKKKPFQLSGGEGQRVAIARCLLSQPELLLMDEPFSNLDRQRRVEIICYLRRISRELGIPMLVISHDLEDLLQLTESLVIIQDRKVGASGSYQELSFGRKNRLLLTGS